MRVRQLFGLVDIGVLTVVVLAAAMPAREMYASPAVKGSEEAKFALALAEARTLAQPLDGSSVDELGHLLGDLNQKDLAIQVSIDGSKRTKGAPEQWRAELAASTAFVDRLEAKQAHDWVRKALVSCTAAGEVACPSYEATRMDIYRQHLEAGIASGAVDANGHVTDPKKFRAAGEGKIRAIRIGH
jgi:hypothetical protein